MPTRVMNKVVFKDVRGEEGQSGLVKNSCNKNNVSCSDETSSYSIGKNSDLSENLSEKSGEEDEEVQSKYNMDALEEVLPIRRGISRFYNGKSKSFASLADASSSSSIKEIAKPDNAYTRKRRNMLACNLTPLNGGGISKSSSRSSLALAVAMSSSQSDEQKGVLCNSNGGRSLSVLSSSRNDFCSLRSFSLADLQKHCVSVGVSCSNLHEFDAKPS